MSGKHPSGSTYWDLHNYVIEQPQHGLKEVEKSLRQPNTYIKRDPVSCPCRDIGQLGLSSGNLQVQGSQRYSMGTVVRWGWSSPTEADGERGRHLDSLICPVSCWPLKSWILLISCTFHHLVHSQSCSTPAHFGIFSHPSHHSCNVCTPTTLSHTYSTCSAHSCALQTAFKHTWGMWHVYSHQAFPCLSPPCSTMFLHILGHFPMLPTCPGLCFHILPDVPLVSPLHMVPLFVYFLPLTLVPGPPSYTLSICI